jgi:hypothetical protein
MAVVLAYHGCSRDTARKLLIGESFRDSTKPYDWLGRGVYFWEADPLRAWDWALRHRPQSPSLVGAAIDLGNCLDLTGQSGLRAVRDAYEDYRNIQASYGRPMPINEDPPGWRVGDLVLRHLDCSVVDHLNTTVDKEAARHTGVQRFQTIRALFPEGEPLYPTAGFRELTHIQICVRDRRQIQGVFRLPDEQRLKLRLPELYAEPAA